MLMRRTLDPGDPVSQTEVDEALKALEAADSLLQPQRLWLQERSVRDNTVRR